MKKVCKVLSGCTTDELSYYDDFKFPNEYIINILKKDNLKQFKSIFSDLKELSNSEYDNLFCKSICENNNRWKITDYLFYYAINNKISLSANSWKYIYEEIPKRKDLKMFIFMLEFFISIEQKTFIEDIMFCTLYDSIKYHNMKIFRYIIKYLNDTDIMLTESNINSLIKVCSVSKSYRMLHILYKQPYFKNELSEDHKKQISKIINI